MPGSDTSDLSDTSVGLLLQKLGSPSLGDSVESVSLGDTDNVDDLLSGEDIVDLDVLLEPLLGVGDLVGDGSTVDLDFNNGGLLGVEGTDQVWLGVDDESDDSAVLDQSVDLGLEVLVVELLDILAESLLLGRVPVLVEPSLEALGELGRPDGGQSSESLWGVDVTNDTDSLDWWGLDDGDGLDDLNWVKNYQLRFSVLRTCSVWTLVSRGVW